MNNNNNNNNNTNIHTPLSNRSDMIDSNSMASTMYPSNSLSSVTSSNTYSVSRPFSQPTFTPMTPDLDPSSLNTNNSVNGLTVQQNNQRRQIIHHLTLLLHAHKCLQREQQMASANNCNGDIHATTSQYSCTLPHCDTMRAVLQHMTKCSDFKSCSFNYCVHSRHIILHWKNCTSPTCFLCSTLKRSCALRTANPQPVREWQQRLDQGQRNALVKKIVNALLKTFQQDARSLPPDRLAAITNFAQQTETDTYNTATGYEDYFQRLAERIYKTQKDSEEKQMLQKQQSLPATLSSIDRSAGERGPPNRIAPSFELPTSSSSTGNPAESSASATTVDRHRITTNGFSQLTKHLTSTNGETNGNHLGGMHVKAERMSPTVEMKIQTTTTTTLIKQEEKVPPTETSNAVTTNDSVTVKHEKIEVDANPGTRPAQIDATSKSLPKHPAVFSTDELRQKMSPILHRLYNHDDGSWFRQPVTEAIAPGYFDIIKNPMDFSTIMKKLNANEYLTPFQFCEDIWLVFSNTWTFNKKSHRVYKAGLKLSEIFMDNVDPIMKEYGYCCGRQYVFLPSAMFCYGSGGICCTIPRDGDYFVYNNPDSSRANLSGDKYTFCKKCFDSIKTECILVGDEPTQSLVELPKLEFLPAKNDHQEPEPTVDCIVCARRFHNICILYHEHIWPEGYVCKTCVHRYNIKRKDNRYLAHKLTTTDLANVLEKRVNDLLQRECEPETGRVTVRILATSDKTCEVKPRLKKHFGPLVSDGYPYRTKAIFAFQEIDGVDVVLFGMHVQEYDSRCPAPNAKRVYISYLDSVHYFRPKQKRTAVYYEILIGYLAYVKQLGFAYAHIWACPPGEGDDYIFHCHPPEQRVPKPKRLQEWYKTMLDDAIQQRVVIDYKDIMKDCTDNDITKATDLPYFEGDFWSSTIEDLIKELDIEEEDRRKFEEQEAVKASEDGCFDDPIEPEEPTEISDKRKSGGGTIHKKKNFKKTTSQRRIARKNMTTGSDLISKIYAMMEKHKESFFVVRLRNPLSNPATSTDTDPLIQCDLMESRDAFLNFAREKHCEFSTLRRAKFSTMASLIELHSSTADKLAFTCNACRQPCDVRYHCTVCEEYDLCSKCHTNLKHEHRMERTDDSSEATSNADAAINLQHQRQVTMQRMLDAIRHAIQCRNANCLSKNCSQCKLLIKHTRECNKVSRNQCALCNKLFRPIWYHAKTCVDPTCSLPYCAAFKQKLQRQRAATAQSDRRRIGAMHRANEIANSSPMNAQTPEPTSVGQYHASMDSSSPNSAGKMAPAGGKGGKLSSMSSTMRVNLSQPAPVSQHPAYYNGGKGNPSEGSYPMMMSTATTPHPQQWMSMQQTNRYPSPTGKPMNFGPQRVPYPQDPYMLRPAVSQMAPANYSYPQNTAPPSYPHSQAMDSNTMAMTRPGNPMLTQQTAPMRYPHGSYFAHSPSMPYPQQSPLVAQHRTLSQPGSSSGYSLAPTSASSNGAGSKYNLIDTIEARPDEIFDDPSKLPSSQQQMFHPLLQSRSRPPSTPYYSNVAPSNNAYYPAQRPMTPSSDYNMSVVRGPAIRPPSVPSNAYGTLSPQTRVRTPLPTSLSFSGGDLPTGMNSNAMGHPSPAPSGPPR